MEAAGGRKEAEAEATRDKVTFTQSLPNLAFIDTNEVREETGLTNSHFGLGGHNEDVYCQVHQNWPPMRPTDNSIISLMVCV